VGHTRYAAAQKLGMDIVPVHVAADLTPQQAKAYRLTDNRTAQENDWATDLLALELTDLQEDGFDLDILGFDQSEIDALFDNDTPDFAPASTEEQGRLDEKKKVCCPECGHEFSL
jgi:ParB-like chromosome segregation protein Spo0J